MRVCDGQVCRRVTIFVPARLHAAAKRAAEQRGISERELYQQLVVPPLQALGPPSTAGDPAHASASGPR